ncbi:MAG: transglycosylase SLT domain-containing protein [Candidatus Jacksonbacteria bacterium]|nr:transglycosylase SLT domain-containing protein [Candidatus Jacksonbacteria bacterium]
MENIKNFFTPQSSRSEMPSAAKLLLFFLTIFAIQSVLLLVLALRPFEAGAQSRAGEENQNPLECPCGFLNTGSSQTGTKIDTTRLYIPIPGVTDACGYVCDVSGDGRGDVVDYIFTTYKLLVGIAAIVAFAMIVYAGYEWIFAMGNSGKIGDAKERIMSACIGLALALVSVQFLQTLSPQLTNLYLPDVTKIARASVNPFCRDTDIVFGTNTADPENPVAVALPSARPEDQTQLTCQSQFTVAVRFEGDKAYCYSTNKDKCWTEIKAKFGNPPKITGEDGKQVEITYENIITYDAKSAPKCQGTYCGAEPENVCYPSDPYARAFECKSAENACEDQDHKRNGCEEVNTWLKYQGYRDQQCAKVVKTGQGDSCVLGRPLQCPNEYSVRVQGDAVFATDAEKKCWEKKGQSEAVLKDCTAWYDPRQIYPVLSGEAIKGAGALCCQKPNSTDYKCETENSALGFTDSQNVYFDFDLLKGSTGDPYQDTVPQLFSNNCNKTNSTEPNQDWINSNGQCFIQRYFDKPIEGKCEVQVNQFYSTSHLPYSGSVERGICMPKDNSDKYGIKVCSLYKTNTSVGNVLYSDFDQCDEFRKKELEESGIQGNCIPMVVSSSNSCDGSSGVGDKQTNASSVISPEIETAVETVVNSNTALKNAFANQQIGFQNKQQFFSANTAFAAEQIDACTFVQAIIAKESSGNAKAAVPSNGGVDCGLMQIHLTSGSDRTACENEKDKNDLDSDGNYDENLLDPGFNVAVGVQRLINWFNSSKLCGSGTSCDAAKRGTAGGDKLYRYVLAANNGGSEANKKSGTDGVCSIESAEAEKCCANSCKDLKNKDGSQACYISSQSDIFPTKVECPNDRGEYQGTYDYVFKIEELYKSLKNTGGAGVASCPS